MWGICKGYVRRIVPQVWGLVPLGHQFPSFPPPPNPQVLEVGHTIDRCISSVASQVKDWLLGYEAKCILTCVVMLCQQLVSCILRSEFTYQLILTGWRLLAHHGWDSFYHNTNY